MAWKHIPVYIRTADDTTSIAFGEASSDDLDEIIATIRAWGTVPDGLTPVGQFVVDVAGGNAFFEVVLTTDG